ncbi:MAG: hypothetical protein Q4G65_11095 [bacterium]|nr:hypothetical protein [bacterium]
MFCEWNGRQVILWGDHREFIRRYWLDRSVICAVASGDMRNAVVAITMDNGHTSLYSGTGALIRR